MTRQTKQKYPLLLFALALLLFPHDASASEDPVTPAIEKSILAEDWNTVADSASEEQLDRSPALRMIKGHACLALNRNNESLCLFLSCLRPEEIRAWDEWTISFAVKHPSAVALYLRADAQARSGRSAEAISTLSTALERMPGHALTLNCMGVLQSITGDARSARKFFEHALTSDPKLADAHSNMGFRFIQIKDAPEGAKAAFDKALALSPDFGLAMHGRGCIGLIANHPGAWHDFEAASAKITCAESLIGANYFNLMAYMEGKDRKEMLAALAENKPGAIIGSKFEADLSAKAGSAWYKYAMSPTQTNYNNWASITNKMSDSQLSGFMAATVNPELKTDSGLRTTMQAQTYEYVRWNHTGAKDAAAGAERFLNGLGGGSAVLMPLPAGVVTAGLTPIVAGGVRDKLDSWSNINYHNGLRIESGASFAPPPGGVRPGGMIIDEGDWPFDPIYGLVYPWQQVPHSGGTK